jgi:regulator of sigma E protease
MKVEAFSIGFGPKIYSWVKDGIEYSVRWIPAGGYVKLPQMITSETLEGKNEAAEQIPPASPWSKILVAFAGPFMNVVFAFAIATLIYFVGLPVPVNPSIIGYVDPNSPEAALGIQPGDKIVQVNGKRIKSWQEVQMTAALSRVNPMPVVIERGTERKTYQLAAQVNEVLGLKMLNLDPRDHPEVIEVLSGGSGEKAGLKAKDVVLSFAGVPIASREQLIELIRSRPKEPTEMLVKRGEEKLTIQITPIMNPATKKGQIGVSLGNGSENVYQLQRPGPLPWEQVIEVWDKTVATLSALFHPKETGVGVKDLSGPPGILAMLADQLRRDYRLALSFLVLLNVNLAIINLFPVPVLDGGHILMAIIEKLRGRALSVRTLEYITTAFAVLLIGFMLYVSFNDFRRFSLFKSMFQGETRIEQSTPAPEPEPAKP